jgi:UDP-N-acetylglucosamine 3-dehydrogenase
MDRLRVGVIGVGDWGEKHLQALRTVPNVEVTAICDTDKARAQKVAARHRVRRSYTDFKELFGNEDLDAVHVVTPEPAHRAPVVEAARRGVHVLVEKPLATSLQDADSMIEATKKHKVILMVGHVLRWDSRYAMVKDYIEQGKVGKIGTIFARRSVSRAQAPIFLGRSTPVMQLGIHDIDLILWYTGLSVEQVYTRSARFFDYKHPDMTSCMLNLEGGAHAVVQNSFSLPENVPFFVGARMEIVGSKGFVIIDASEQSLFFCDKSGWRTPDTTLIPVVRNNMVGTLAQEVNYFIQCVARGQNPKVISPSESRNALKVAIACEKSMSIGMPVHVGRSDLATNRP